MEHLDYESFKNKIFDPEKESTQRFYIGKEPCIVDFYTKWCTPCKEVDKYLQKISEETSRKVKIYKIDCEKEKEIAEKLKISSFPHLLFLKSNQLPKSLIGLYPNKYIQEIVEKELLNKGEIYI
ncbi:MAG: thioredoxin domain-containing protein [Bacteroidales bacterium]|nr:thioredoxin domain-containing protein [Bacteroidales bacterium]